MKQEGINVIAYDMHMETGGKIKHKDAASSTKHQQTSSMIRKVGPSILKQHEDRTLFLCYPDERGEGIGAECLENFWNPCRSCWRNVFGFQLRIGSGTISKIVFF
jgi:hypothetical protein